MANSSMSPTVASRLERVEVRQVKSTLPPAAAALQELSCVPGELVEKSLALALLDHEEAATKMGVSGSLLSRQIKNLDNQHLSLQRLWNLPDSFWVAFIVLAIEERHLSSEPVRREIRITL